jgi:hypothetical protein
MLRRSLGTDFERFVVDQLLVTPVDRSLQRIGVLLPVNSLAIDPVRGFWIGANRVELRERLTADRLNLSDTGCNERDYQHL